MPAAVKVTVEDQTVRVEGPKGKLSKDFDKSVRIRVEGDSVIFEPLDNSKHSRAMWGTARSIVSGMVAGVVEPFSKNLQLEGVGFKADVQGRVVNLALGFSHPIHYSLPDGVSVTVDANTKIKVEGCDKQLVGKVAADIKSYYPVEPYKGKGVRILGEYVRRKEGKKTA